MAFDEDLAQRVRDHLGGGLATDEKKMFGGICWMVQGNMCVGVLGDELIVRVPKEETDAVCGEDHVRAFDFTGRPMRGFVVVGPGALAGDGLGDWVDRSLAFVMSLPPK